jgi:phospholipid/cholesterol/gamma-HCH transport system permease protein
VVISFMLLFLTNFIITAIYFQVVRRRAADGDVGTPLPPRLARPARVPRGWSASRCRHWTTSARSCPFYARSLGWTYRVLLRYKKEVSACSARWPRVRGTRAGGGTSASSPSSPSSPARRSGCRATPPQPARRRQLHRVHLGLLQHPRDRPAGAGLALSATVGAGFTAQLGAMRVSEEVDALEVMGVPSLPFLVTTRMIAGFIAVTPLYVIGLLSSYFAARTITTGFYGQSTGTYDQYFNQYLPPVDVLYSFLKVLIFAVIIILIHCYYGYYASGGPAGVGVAVGRAVRTAIVAINVVDFFLSLAIWGATTTVRIAG